MGCSASSAVLDQQAKAVRGYTSEQFVHDHLIPLDIFACNTPPKDNREEMEELAEELFLYDRACSKEYTRASKGKERLNFPCVPKKAFCKVRLNRADIAVPEGSCIDLRDNIHGLDVRLHGGILCPCSAKWWGIPSKDNKQAFKVDVARKGDEPLAMSVQFVCHIYSTTTVIDGSERAGVGIKLKHAVVRLTGDGGEPMVESWLPIDDMMKCLTLVLNKKLKAVIELEVKEMDKWN